MNLVVTFLLLITLIHFCCSQKFKDATEFDHTKVYDDKEYLVTEHFGNIKDHPCKRDCGCKQRPRMCKYFLTITSFESSLADGRLTYTLAYNGTVPGPAIEVCRGDIVVIKLLNLSNTTSAMHLHGMTMRNTPGSDGPALVTQYASGPGTIFVSKFYTNDVSGTFWYHPHDEAFGRCFGAMGALIIREPCQKPDFCEERIIFISDLHLYNSFNSVDDILINGRGKQQGNSSTDILQYPFIEVPRGKCVKLRIILSFCSVCSVLMYMPDVVLTVVASDGHCVEPREVQSIQGLSAERFDVIIKLDKLETYWLNVKACDMFQGLRIVVTDPKQPPIKESNPYKRLIIDQLQNGSQFNSFDASSRFPGTTDIPMADALKCDPQNYKEDEPKPYKTLYFSLGRGRNNGTPVSLFGEISYQPTKYSILDSLNVPSIRIEDTFCDIESEKAKGRDCVANPGICKCTHVVYFKCHEYYEIVVSNTFRVGHPLHLHGLEFVVVGQGYNQTFDLSTIEAQDKANPFHRNSAQKAPIKDTVIVPPLGFVILRFLVDNPGPWLWHCHFENHAHEGMAMVAMFCRDKINFPPSVNNCQKKNGYCSAYENYKNLY